MALYFVFFLCKYICMFSYYRQVHIVVERAIHLMFVLPPIEGFCFYPHQKYCNFADPSNATALAYALFSCACFTCENVASLGLCLCLCLSHSSTHWSFHMIVRNDRRPLQKSGMCCENRNTPNFPDLSVTIPDERGCP